MTHFINQKWGQGKGPLFESLNPANQDVVWKGHAGSVTEVQAAVKAARNAFPTWFKTPLKKRIAFLELFREELKNSEDALAEAISQEIGKPLWESKSEVNAMITKVSISIDAYHKRCPEITHQFPSYLSITRHKPHGVIAIFGPFNFPGHLPNGHIIPALLAGNTIVLKPSELAPLVSETIINLWEKCKLPAGVINLVQGGRETGRLLAQHPEIDGLFFTGSWATGRIFAEQFAPHPQKILALEMGGNNPLVFDKVDDINAAAYTTIQSAFLTSGQRCTCARRLIVVEGNQGAAFIAELVRMTQGIKVGPYTSSPEPFMGPVISTHTAKQLLEAQRKLISLGGSPLIEMQQLEPDSALLFPGIIDVSAIQNRPDEEIFGPLLQLIRVPDFNAAIQEANRTVYGLTAGLMSKQESHYRQFYQQIRAGVINWNYPLTGASSAAPFGGIGHSGNHRPSAFYAADYCAYPVASMESPTINLPTHPLPGLSS